jgi:phosphoadenosine phosphosulfate reductase
MNATEVVTNYETLPADTLVEQVIREAAGAPICFTNSFQTEDMVVLHMLRQQLPNVHVIFLETGYHFPEVIAYRDRLTAEWGLNLVNAMPELTLAQHEGRYGLLHIVQPTECCRMRKVEPLMRSLEPFDWWFTGLRREQSPTRANLRKVEDHRTPAGKQMKKVSILADWTMDDVNAYAAAHSIPKLELYARGYTSIGCAPCTAIPDDPSNPRAGRWGGKKLECGIHTFSDKI